MSRIGVLFSGRGSNFQRLVEAARRGEIPDAEVACGVTDRPCGAAETAQKLRIKCRIVEPAAFQDKTAWMQAVTRELQKHKIDLVILAGFLRKIERPLLEAFPAGVLNIHPALLPRFGGKGMYGLKVHRAVLAAGAKETGVTIHLVDEAYDHGPILYQEKIPVLSDDTAETLAQRVLALEHAAYPKAIAAYLQKMRRP